MPYNYLFALILGIMPSAIWLIFYLGKDIHPEPKKWLFLVFISGIAITPLAIGIQWQAIEFFNFLHSAFPVFFSAFLKNMAIIFIGIAAIEEFFKYLAVRIAMKHNPFFDEPEDAMIYMIVAALGFAAVENIIIVHSYLPSVFISPTQPLATLALRFVGATFLHTLSSAIVGFYYALSLTDINQSGARHYQIIAKGLIIAIFLHGIFNYFILISEYSSAIYFSIPLFIILIFISKDFKILQGISPKKFNN